MFVQHSLCNFLVFNSLPQRDEQYRTGKGKQDEWSLNIIQSASTSSVTRDIEKRTKNTENVLDHLYTTINSYLFPSSSCYNSSPMWFSGWAFSVGSRKDREGKMVNSVLFFFLQTSISSAVGTLPLQFMVTGTEYPCRLI